MNDVRKFLDPVVETNSQGECVAWLHDGPTVGIYETEDQARQALTEWLSR